MNQNGRFITVRLQELATWWPITMRKLCQLQTNWVDRFRAVWLADALHTLRGASCETFVYALLTSRPTWLFKCYLDLVPNWRKWLEFDTFERSGRAEQSSTEWLLSADNCAYSTGVRNSDRDEQKSKPHWGCWTKQYGTLKVRLITLKFGKNSQILVKDQLKSS
jgi:hypothetical protein